MRQPVFWFLTEFNLPMLFIWCLARQPVYLIDILPVLPASRRLLVKAAQYLIRRGRLKDAYTDHADAKRIFNRPHYCDYTDIFVKLKDWVPSYFHFDKLAASLAAYAMPYKHTAWQETYDLADHVLTIQVIRSGDTGRACTFVGASDNLLAVYEAYTGDRLRAPTYDWASVRWLMNLVQSIAVAAYIILWSLRRLVLQRPAQKRYFLGST